MATLTKAGRYEVVGELGRGAMGVVYKAMDPVIGRTVAVKTIRLSEMGSGLSRPELLQRFQTEARAAGLLTHPNIVVVYDAGEEDGLYYITMELVEGKSLQALLDGGQGFPLARVLRILEQTCSALQFAHERNVVHRDIKPANLMMTADDTVKVTDFGTAKILQFGTTQQTAHVMGTPSYMSPEQVKGKAVDGRSDIFSLGVMFYEMMTGEKPFPGQNITAVIYKIVNEDPVPPRQINPSIHPGINAVILKALAKDPNARYQSCQEMIEELRNYRALSGNADSTMILSAAPPSAGGWASRDEESPAGSAAQAAHASLGNGSPSQTPALRRPGVVAPYQEPEKSPLATALAALFLLAVIVFGGSRLRPFFQDLIQRRETQRTGGKALSSGVSAAPVAGTSAGTAANDPDGSSASPAGESVPEKTPETPPAASGPTSAPSKRSMSLLQPAAAGFKARAEEAISEKGLSGRVTFEGTGNTLTVAGKLRPHEHHELLTILRSAPESVHIVDDISYEDTAEPAGGNETEGDHPLPEASRGAIHVVTDVIGASAVLRGSTGSLLGTCQTPCSFTHLSPATYTVDVHRDGYRPVQVPVRASPNNVSDLRIALETLAKGVYVSSRPPGADVFLNGSKQPGRTPMKLALEPGQFNIVVKLEGYEAYSEQLQVKNNVQAQLDVLLTPHANRPAWADVKTEPSGAQIVIDETPTGLTTPARVKTTAGMHRVSLILKGFRPLTRMVLVEEGQTVQISASLQAH